MCATNGRTKTDWATQPMDECPNTPEDPVSIETYEAMIAAMDKMIAEPPDRTGQRSSGCAGPGRVPPSNRRRIQGRRRA
jgi:hypothetical protein